MHAMFDTANVENQATESESGRVRRSVLPWPCLGEATAWLMKRGQGTAAQTFRKSSTMLSIGLIPSVSSGVVVLGSSIDSMHYNDKNDSFALDHLHGKDCLDSEHLLVQPVGVTPFIDLVATTFSIDDGLAAAFGSEPF